MIARVDGSIFERLVNRGIKTVRNFLAVILIAVAAAVGANSALADEEAVARAVPLNFMACYFVEGKGMSDLNPVLERFDRWATRYDAKYTAWVMTPRYYNNPNMYDVAWLGTWPDGKTFGVSQDAWVSQGVEVLQAFGEVIDCRVRELASSVEVYTPNGAPEQGVWMFSHCTLKDGKTLGDAYRASRELAETMAGLGSSASHFMFYPGLGAGDLGFDFWRVTTFSNFTELGEFAEIYINGGGWDETTRTVGSIASCTSPNTFDARMVHSGTTRRGDKL